MNWNIVEYSSEPSTLDTTSSSTLVYIRKDVVFVEATEDKDAHWECLEHAVKAEQWELYKSIIENTSALADVEDALIELAGMIGG